MAKKASMGTRKEIVERHKAQYKKSTKSEKGKILDSVCLGTGLSRSRVKHLLSETSVCRTAAKPIGRGRKKKYDGEVIKALEAVWVIMDFASGKRLAAGMSDMLDALQRFGEIDFSEEIIAKLREMSASTVDRLLAREKERMRFKGISTTKPGTLLKRDIPIRTGTDWNEDMPGFVEIDLVAHCGQSTVGEYVNTLDVTDICSGWTETRAVINKAQRHVFEALSDIETNQPFPFCGIDSDNGSEFINHELYRYCKESGILFTRSRPYTKNDGCHVEQKNWHLVRRNIGYGRYEGQTAVELLNQYYGKLRLLSNFFMPSAKLIAKTRDGARVSKRYETPFTPYRRLLASEYILPEVKARLQDIYASLNPAALKRDMMNLLGKILKLRIQER